MSFKEIIVSTQNSCKMSSLPKDLDFSENGSEVISNVKPQNAFLWSDIELNSVGFQNIYVLICHSLVAC